MEMSIRNFRNLHTAVTNLSLVTWTEWDTILKWSGLKNALKEAMDETETARFAIVKKHTQMNGAEQPEVNAQAATIEWENFMDQDISKLKSEIVIDDQLYFIGSELKAFRKQSEDPIPRAGDVAEILSLIKTE